jgi:SAM-dependent methyltransferase
MSNPHVTEEVSEERWEAAQSWEHHHWVRTQQLRAKYGKNVVWRLLSFLGLVSKYRGDDWNHWWKKQFEEYAFLPPTVENALEVGCGPYTNVRLMLDRCRFGHLFLSDPLIRTYANFKLTFVSEMYRKLGCTLDDHALEELPFASGYFDLIVMINVLDHVRDARLCMETVIRVIKPGGILVLGQDLTNEEDLVALKNDGGAIGHPIKLDHHWFTPYLERFTPIIKKVLEREESRAPTHHYGDLIFAGRFSGGST